MPSTVPVSRGFLKLDLKPGQGALSPYQPHTPLLWSLPPVCGTDHVTSRRGPWLRTRARQGSRRLAQPQHCVTDGPRHAASPCDAHSLPRRGLVRTREAGETMPAVHPVFTVLVQDQPDARGGRRASTSPPNTAHAAQGGERAGRVEGSSLCLATAAL